jgi:glycosyltransferase involved in cell wall biosynthesis
MLPSLVRRHPRVVLALAGEERSSPGMRQLLERRAAELGMRDHAYFLGHRSDMTAVYAASDVLLHCGIFETFGMVLVEAMAVGLPVVAINIRGPSEIVIDRETGRLVAPPGDPDEVANALSEILADPERAAKMGAQGRVRARSFGVDRFVERLEALCALMIAGPIPYPGSGELA